MTKPKSNPRPRGREDIPRGYVSKSKLEKEKEDGLRRAATQDNSHTPYRACSRRDITITIDLAWPRAQSGTQGDPGTCTSLRLFSKPYILLFDESFPPIRDFQTLPHSVQAGEIVGWRYWKVSRLYLHSVTAGNCWLPDEVMHGKPNTYPKGFGPRGIHAYNNQMLANWKGRMFSYKMPSHSIIGGTIAMWGTVLEFEKGFRAEHAKILTLDEIWFQGHKQPPEDLLLSILREKYLGE